MPILTIKDVLLLNQDLFNPEYGLGKSLTPEKREELRYLTYSTLGWWIESKEWEGKSNEMAQFAFEQYLEIRKELEKFLQD